MSIPDRIFRISKAYLNQVRDRIDAELAERELDAGLAPGGLAEAGAAARDRNADRNDRGDRGDLNDLGEDASVRVAEEMMRQAEEKIAAARREMESRSELDPERTAPDPVVGAGRPSHTSGNMPSMSSNQKSSDSDPNAADFRVLGIPVGSDLATVQDAYEKLARRCDPRRFPESSQEQKDAQRILERVNSAYEALRNRLDPTQNRFGKLELE